VLLKACLNGPRQADEHAALPVSVEALAADAVACVRAGAGAIHMHPRDAEGRESLEVGVVDAAVRTVREACGVPVGVATGAWVEPDPGRRAELVSAWTEPDFASVNLSEPGAVEVMRARQGIVLGRDVSARWCRGPAGVAVAEDHDAVLEARGVDEVEVGAGAIPVQQLTRLRARDEQRVYPET